MTTQSPKKSKDTLAALRLIALIGGVLSGMPFLLLGALVTFIGLSALAGDYDSELAETLGAQIGLLCSVSGVLMIGHGVFLVAISILTYCAGNRPVTAS
jgi:hypothetical protein